MGHSGRLIQFIVVFGLLFVPGISRAQTTVPQYLNFQSVVMDDSGNLITDSFINLNFKILDKDGNLVYEEDQKQVQVVKGAVNVMIGEGTIPNSSSPTGGITMEALDPREGAHFLRVTIGNNQPLNDMELLSTPYAMYAEQALSIPNNTITSDHIINGTIKIEDLEPGLAFSNLSGTATESQLPTSLATDTELSAHINSTMAHAAANITVRGPYLSSDASDLESVLIALDRRVMNFYNNNQEFLDNETSLREAAETTLQTNIDTEATTRGNADTAETAAREAAVTAEATARTAADTAEASIRAGADTTLQSNIDTEESSRISADNTLQSNVDAEAATRASEDQRILDSEISRAGDTIYGDLTFFTDETLADQTMTLAPSTGNITTDGEISVLGGMVSVERDSVSGEPILLIEDMGGVERLRFNAETGALTVDGQVVLTGTVDGVDVSTLDSDFDAHTTATTAHGSDGNIVGQDTLNSAINTHSSTDIAIAHSSGNLSTSRLSGQITGAQIASDSISSGQIVNGTTTTDDLNAVSFSAWDQNAADDVTGIGDCDSGDCFTDTSNNNALVFEGSVNNDNEVTLKAWEPSMDTEFRLPSITCDGSGVCGGTLISNSDVETVSSAMIRDEAITDLKLESAADGDYPSSVIDNFHRAVGTNNIKNSAVTAAKIASNAVGPSEIAANAVDADKIEDGSVGSAEIATGAVGSSEIATGAVGSSELVNGLGMVRVNCAWSGDIDESGGSYTCPGNKVVAGRAHQGDENGDTQYYCCDLVTP